MERIEVNRKELSKALGQVRKTAARKVTFPVLRNVLVDTEENTLTTTNLSETTVRNIEIQKSSENGSRYLIPIDFLLEVVKKVSDDKVTIVIDDNTITEVNGLHSNTRLDDIDEFPTSPDDMGEFTHICDLTKDIAKTITSLLPRNPVYSKVYEDSILFEDNKMVSTDGYRIYLASLQVGKTTLVPVTILRIAESLAKEFSIYSSDKYCQITFKDVTIRSENNNEKKYVDYKMAIPEDHDFTEMESNILQAVNEVTPIFSKDEETPKIKVKLGMKGMEISCTLGDGTVNSKFLSMDLRPFDEENDTFYLNQKFFVEALKCFGGKFELGVPKEGPLDKSVILMKNDVFMVGVMPFVV